MAELAERSDLEQRAYEREGQNRVALAYALPAVIWLVLVALAWSLWWLAGPENRTAIAGSLNLSANQFGLILFAALAVENIIAKCMLCAALWHWLR